MCGSGKRSKAEFADGFGGMRITIGKPALAAATRLPGYFHRHDAEGLRTCLDRLRTSPLRRWIVRLKGQILSGDCGIGFQDSAHRLLRRCDLGFYMGKRLKRALAGTDKPLECAIYDWIFASFSAGRACG